MVLVRRSATSGFLNVCWHCGQDGSLLWETVLCTVECLQHPRSLPTRCISLPWIVTTQNSSIYSRMFPGEPNLSPFESLCARIRQWWGNREVWYWLMWPKGGKGRGEAGSQRHTESATGKSPEYPLFIFHCCFSSPINLALLYEPGTRAANGLQALTSQLDHREGLSAPYH